jgi:hypothetical protein
MLVFAYYLRDFGVDFGLPNTNKKQGCESFCSGYSFLNSFANIALIFEIISSPLLVLLNII